ncbi:PH domain-containing protein [Paenibacillus sp. YPG26]|uniref:PH domain-containing protein n=1 Tax=Paenibacillus sp. YPG26 TaxID=2878915 RepID=UPI00203B2B42|nr:PH domain-containing protein [Paenibacillus sp. YPG26]USB34560.1 PH domain-containing protein [Paenibacillus sp. YPG26]
MAIFGKKVNSIENGYEDLLIDDETIESVHTLFKNQAVLTNMRVIFEERESLNEMSLSFIVSIPYSKINAIALERKGFTSTNRLIISTGAKEYKLMFNLIEDVLKFQKSLSTFIFT